MVSQLHRGEQAADALVRLVIPFLRKRFGRGPEGYRTYVIDDMIILRLFNAMTPVEQELIKTSDGRRVVRETRAKVLDDLCPVFQELLKTTTGASVVSVHTDLSTRTGERLLIFVLDHKSIDLPVEAAPAGASPP